MELSGEKKIEGNSAVLSPKKGGKKVEEELAEGAEEGMRGSAAGSSKGPTVEDDQSQAAGPEVGEACIVEEDMEYESDSDSLSLAGSQAYSGDLYKLEEINNFLDETFGKTVKVLDHFPDANKFVESVLAIQKGVGVESLDLKKRYRLKKHLTTLRKQMSKKKGSIRVGGFK